MFLSNGILHVCFVPEPFSFLSNLFPPVEKHMQSTDIYHYKKSLQLHGCILNASRQMRKKSQVLYSLNYIQTCTLEKSRVERETRSRRHNLGSLLHQNRLCWHGHVLWKENNDWVKKYMEYEVDGARRRDKTKRIWTSCAKRSLSF